MGSIKGLVKWDLKNNSWRKIETGEDAKRAFSIATYSDVIHKENDGIHYILIADGYRVENVSKDSESISTRKSGIKKVIEYFEKKGENYRIELLLIDNDAPLREEGKIFARYIDRLASYDDVKSVNYIGFSKCGVVGFDMIKYIKTAKGLAKANIYSVSAPYLGTLAASPKILEIEARKLLEAKLGKNPFSDSVVKAFIKFYRDTLSNSHMDFDIAIPGGVEDEYMDRYDPDFVGDIFNPINVRSSFLPNHFQNICTKIDETTLKRVMKSEDLVGLALIIMNDWFFDGESDGLVPLKSQQSIESHIYRQNCSDNLIIPSPHGVIERPYSDELLSVVNTTIEEKPYTMRPKI